MDGSPWASDPRVHALREKMLVIEDLGFTEDYRNPKKRSCANAIQVNVKDGRKSIPEIVVEYPLGHPVRQDTLEQVAVKLSAI